MKSNSFRTLSALSVLSESLLVAACGSTANPSSGDDYTAGAPELAAVQMRITGDGNAEALATADDTVEADSLASDELAAVTNDAAGAGTPDLNGAREAVHDLNQALRDSLISIVALVRDSNPTYRLGDLRVWGPVLRGETEFRFIMRHPAPRSFRWRLDGRLAGTAAYSRIAAGEIAVGLRPRRGVGTAGFDLDTLHSVDPTVHAQGQILAGFAHGKLGTTLAFGLKNFTRDPVVKPGIDALLQEVHLVNEVNRVRLAYRGNVEGTATAAEELVFARVRHSAGIGGRSDMIVTSGDVPAGQAWVISQCWNAALDQTYRIVRNCPLDGLGGASCTVTSTVGDETACDVNLRAEELPPGDPSQPMPDSADPNGGVTAPTAIPDVAGDPLDAG